ncbi:hypothetical protein B0H17DRAFT_1199507 [Mycena rosella]|uniref:F-box domain-containing protein n=1 Tax=Mycena rosella TaxID=1033263 RepID=A0AAD7DKG3_MYCRO|nr:hypothetical protein B0H17DRAFT_1199507 [Mycena rosella]
MGATELRQRLLQLDAQIVVQRLALDALEQTRLDVERELHATATFPVAELPAELITEIFLWCHPMHEDTFEVPSDVVCNDRSIPSPLTLASVCRRWRDLALSTPELWSRIEFGFRDGSSASEASQRVKQWLDRAAPRPLTVSLHARKSQRDESSITQHLRHLIHLYSGTIQHLTLVMLPQIAHQLGLESLQLPLLRSVCLWHSSMNGGVPHTPHPVMLFTDAPLLSKLRVSHFGATLLYYTLPWLQLTKFHGQIHTMELFIVAPNLTEVICSVPYLTFTQTVITHQRLQSLILTVSQNDIKPDDILCYLTLPALQSLHISEMDDTRYSSLYPFLSRSSPPLLSLSIRLDDAYFYDLKECFRCVQPTLETLTMEYPSEAVRQSLYQHEQWTDGFPQLHTLKFANVQGVNFTELLQFLYDRQDLRSFQLSCTEGTFLDDSIAVESGSHSITTHFTTLAARGMSVNISSGPKTYLNLVGSA